MHPRGIENGLDDCRIGKKNGFITGPIGYGSYYSFTAHQVNILSVPTQYLTW